MKKPIHVILGVLVILIAMVFTSVASKPSALAAAYGEQDLTITEKISRAEQEAAAAFWTKDALANAEVMVMPIDYGPADPDVFSLEQEIPGNPGSSSPGAARPNANAIARKAYPGEWVNSSQSDSATGNTDITADEIAGSSQVFTSYYGNLWFPAQKIYPHKWVGRFSFITNNGTSYCSATAISKNHIVTAAHCVFDTVINQWYTNKVFTPAYRNGSAPYGSFIATSCTILNQWKYMSGDFSINRWTKYDVAVCRVRTNSEGKTLNYMVGWAGREWDEGYTRNFFNMGYPWKDTSLNYLNRAGQFLRICTAESFQQATDTLGMGCNYGSGISGGPWMISYAPNVLSGYVNSVNSGLYIGQDNLYGIRFTSNNIVPICIEQGCD